MSLSSKIMIGMGLGVLVGLFFGESCSPISVVGDIYVKLMQMSVTPYIILALIYGIGRLNSAEAQQVAGRVIILVIVMWAVGIIVAIAMPAAFPEFASSGYYSAPANAKEKGTDFLDMFIPSNIFHSLSEELVPSIIVFCMFIGTLLMRSERKAAVLDLLRTGIETIEGLASLTAELTPLGVFAMAAATSATMTWTEVMRLQVYVAIYIPVALFVALWVVPWLVSSVIPISWKAFLRHCREPLLVSFTTQSTFIALPLIGKKVRAILMDISQPKNEELAKAQISYVDVILPIVFALPTIGTIFILFFIEYAGWNFASPLKGFDFLKLVGLGLPALFSDFNAIPFLLRQLHLPNDAFGMFLMAGIVTEYFAALLAAVSLISVVTVVVAWATKQTKVRKVPLLLATVGTIVLGGALLFGLRAFLTHSLSQQTPSQPAIMTLTTMDPQVAKVVQPKDQVVLPSEQAPVQGELMADILRRNVIRVAYSPTSMPWSYFNANGELVGYDIEMAHRLAREMHCSLEFIPIDFAHWERELDSRRYDIVMVSFSISPERVLRVSFAEGHRILPAVFVVPDHRKAEFKTRTQISAIPKLRTAVLEGTNRFNVATKQFPSATIVPLKATEDFFKPGNDLADAWYTEAGKGFAYALLYPAFDAVNDEDDAPAAEGYPIPRGELSWQTYVNAFLKVQRENGSEEYLFEKYILGKHPAVHERRWSVIHDVLHWVD